MAATSPKVEAPKTPEPPDEAEGLRARIVGQISSHGFDMGPGYEIKSPEGFKSSVLIKENVDEVHRGSATVQTLYRSYKHAPHSFPALLAKYIVHRVNHADAYDHLESAEDSDRGFLDLHQHGGAKEHNGWVDLKTLHTAVARNPHLVVGMIRHRDWLQNLILRGVGLNVRKIGDEHYVALTRGLNSRTMMHEHALSSHADTQATGFGDHMHHGWVPLKDIWYSYDMGPAHPRGTFGPEDEYLVSNLRTRYEANEKDVRTTRLKSIPANAFGIAGNIFVPGENGQTTPAFFDDHYAGIFDNDTDEQVAEGLREPSLKLGLNFIKKMKNAGPKTWAALKKQKSVDKNLDPLQDLFDAPFVPAQDLLEHMISEMDYQRNSEQPFHSPHEKIFANPNWTESHLARYWDEHKKLFPGALPPGPFWEAKGLTPALVKRIFKDLESADLSKPYSLSGKFRRMSSDVLHATFPELLKRGHPADVDNVIRSKAADLNPQAIEQLKNYDPNFKLSGWSEISMFSKIPDELLDAWIDSNDPKQWHFADRVAGNNQNLTEGQALKLIRKEEFRGAVVRRENLSPGVEGALLDAVSSAAWTRIASKTNNAPNLTKALNRINDNAASLMPWQVGDIQSSLRARVCYATSDTQNVVRGIYDFLGPDVFRKACFSYKLDPSLPKFKQDIAKIIYAAAASKIVYPDGSVYVSAKDHSPQDTEMPAEHLLKPLPAGA